MTRPEIEMRRPAPADADSLTRFFNDVPEEDRNFIKEDVLDPGVVRSWTKDRVAHRLLAWDADKVIAYCAVIPGSGWSSHVGELRIVVAPRHRRRGVGRQMARVALLEAMRMGVEKLFIELIADQEAAIAMFVDLGFVGEALLKNHVRDRQGRLRDLIVLSHDIRDNLAAMQTAGMGQT